MNTPLVSVVMPAYNAEKNIYEAILSILNQTYENIELIVIDDASKDRTYSIIKQFSDNRIIIEKNETNKGIAYTTNKAIKLANGKYIALMDDDDIAFQERIEYQVKFLEKNNDIDILGGRSEDIDESGAHIRYGGMPRTNPNYIKALLLFRCLDFRNGTTMMRRDFIDKYNLRYRDGYLGMQDYQFFIESSKVGKISSIDEYLIKYRIHDDNETKKQQTINKIERERIYSKMRIDSLRMSGFILNEEQIDILNYSFPETNPSKLSKKDLLLLYSTFKEIYLMALEMKIDYIEELNIVLKKLFSEKIYKSNLFSDECNRFTVYKKL